MVSDVASDPDQIMGQMVTVSGEVESILSPHAFILGDDQVPVVTRTRLTDVVEEATAYVTGEVRVFQFDEVADEVDGELSRELLRDFEGDPVILADMVEVVR